MFKKYEFPAVLIIALPLIALQLPLMNISSIALESWTQGNLTHVDEVLTDEIEHPSDPVQYTHALAHRALV